MTCAQCNQVGENLRDLVGMIQCPRPDDWELRGGHGLMHVSVAENTGRHNLSGGHSQGLLHQSLAVSNKRYNPGAFVGHRSG